MIIPFDRGTYSFDHCSLHLLGPAGIDSRVLRSASSIQREKHRGRSGRAAQRLHYLRRRRRADRFRDSSCQPWCQSVWRRHEGTTSNCNPTSSTVTFSVQLQSLVRGPNHYQGDFACATKSLKGF